MPLPPNQPSARDLSDAAVLEQWHLFIIPTGGILLAGYVGGRTVTDLAVAIDTKTGWARVPGEWLVLGEPVRPQGKGPIDWNERLQQDPLPKDAEGMMAWAKRNLFG